MIMSLSIGQANHTPDNRVLYPVYYKTEFSSERPIIYITESDRRDLQRKLEALYMECKRKKQ